MPRRGASGSAQARQARASRGRFPAERGARQVLRILEPRGAGPGSADDQSAVRNHTHQLLQLLAEERARAGGAPGPILDFVLAEDLLERLLRWHVAGDFSEERRAEQLKLYEVLLGQARQPLLRHAPVLRPLLRLLGLCAAAPAAPALQASLVLLLSQLCVCVAREPGLLERFFYRPPGPGPGSGADSSSGPADLLLFSLLVPFVHHEGVTGQQARDALLLIMAMSAGNCTVASYITDHSYFCPVSASSAPVSSPPKPSTLAGSAAPCPCLSRGFEELPSVPMTSVGQGRVEAPSAFLAPCRKPGLGHACWLPAWKWLGLAGPGAANPSLPAARSLADAHPVAPTAPQKLWGGWSCPIGKAVLGIRARTPGSSSQCPRAAVCLSFPIPRDWLSGGGGQGLLIGALLRPSCCG